MGMEIVKVETLGTQNFHFPHSLIHGSLSLDIVYAWDHMGLCGCEADHQQGSQSLLKIEEQMLEEEDSLDSI